MNTSKIGLDTSLYSTPVDRMRAAVAISDALEANPKAGVVATRRGEGNWDSLPCRSYDFGALDELDYRFVPAPREAREFYIELSSDGETVYHRKLLDTTARQYMTSTLMKVREVLE